MDTKDKTEERRRRKGGFTLIELVVVLAILAVLAGIMVPSYMGYVEKAKEKRHLVEAKQLQSAVYTMMMEEAAFSAEGAPEVPEELFWETLDSEKNPLRGFYPAGWKRDGVVTKIDVDEDGFLKEITYSSPEGETETWILHSEDGMLEVEIQTE